MKGKVILSGIAVVAVLFVLGWGYVIVGSWTYSEGERTGIVTKFSHKGMFVKSWEGELNIGGLEQGGIAQVWRFTVDEPQMVEAVQQAQRSGERVTLKYRQQFQQQSWKGMTDYFIVGVETVDK